MENQMGSLNFLDYLDLEETTSSNQDELSRDSLPHAKLVELGQSAVDAAQRGYYINSDGTEIDWRIHVDNACRSKISISPDDPLPEGNRNNFPQTNVQVVNETTLQASRKLVEKGHRPLALNFANGHMPGGSFLDGARAQEEALCRSSALYHTLVDDPMYDYHCQREGHDFESSNWAIYSPDVPVFRMDNGKALDEPWLLSCLTCAAPVADIVEQPKAGDLLEERIHRVLSIAYAYNYSTLVLGAWGCGAFGNDKTRTAKDFRKALENEFGGAFSDIIYAITDWSPERKTFGVFRDVFSVYY